MRVAVYHQTIPPNNKNPEKPALLNNFAQGVRAAGDTVADVRDYNVVPADVGVIQGWITQPDRPHLILRQNVITNTPYTVTADSNLFLYNNPANPGNYLRYSFNGVFPNTGIYCDNNIDPARWRQISRDLKLTVKDWRSNGQHILICLQRNGGWSMGDQNVVEWAKAVVNKIRQHTGRPVIIRAHPGDKKSHKYLANIAWNISNDGRPLSEDLKNCWAVINHNSSAVVGAAIEGVPIFVTDPARSQCAEIANTDLSCIESPQMPNRQPWLERISMFHWNFAELQSGAAWHHMRQYVSER